MIAAIDTQKIFEALHEVLQPELPKNLEGRKRMTYMNFQDFKHVCGWIGTATIPWNVPKILFTDDRRMDLD